ncbi:hypothetical protein D9758_006673 [Tetrapyrgos nigripes]|uniref:Aminotransferase class V domain-containing protein n=1 Tax=Tetrapyrgos nigripes TaxID=182062 RepID=A0A8H5LQS9_9AGAR|nr:hypothetical protein D9758_006673 [Tetrapyrgos nigripes]
MGNSQSSTSYNRREIRRLRSAPALPRFSLGCSGRHSQSSVSSDPSSVLDLANEKSRYHVDVYEVQHSDNSSEHQPQPFSPPFTPSSDNTRTFSQSTHSHQRNLSVYMPGQDVILPEALDAYNRFLQGFPQYRLTWILDSLRRSDYGRLERAKETYVDYMGGSLYPESLVRVHTDFLYESIMGNTHSVSNSSKLSLKCADEARAAVLAFFKATSDYTVVFTPNATAALKLVGESYPFTDQSHYIVCSDSHNSVHGIRQFAINHRASVCYIPSTNHGGFDEDIAKSLLLRHRRSKNLPASLFAVTGQSNITNSKAPFSVIEYAKSLGYHTLLDAAALAPTSSFSLSETPVDAMAISFYKMFGFPTGVGALIVRKSFLNELRRPWFAGGTVEVVQVPGNIVTRSQEPHEQFEDGTINYLTLPAVTDGLRFLSAYLPFLPLRLSCLVYHMATSLSKMRHDVTGIPVVRILSRAPSKPLTSVGELSETGSTVSLIFFDSSGHMIPNSFIEYAATKQNISLRTGCMCNPGGAAAILGIQEDMKKLYPGVTLKDFEHAVGRELGVVRISLGLGSNFQDVWNVLRFVELLKDGVWRAGMWNEWVINCGESTFESVGRAI